MATSWGFFAGQGKRSSGSEHAVMPKNINAEIKTQRKSRNFRTPTRTPNFHSRSLGRDFTEPRTALSSLRTNMHQVFNITYGISFFCDKSKKKIPQVQSGLFAQLAQIRFQGFRDKGHRLQCFDEFELSRQCPHTSGFVCRLRRRQL